MARRTVPALAVTLAVFIAARFMVTQLARPHYMTAITTTSTNPQMPPGSWQLAQGRIGSGGEAFITYQPASRYWAFQGIETGIFVVLAAALIAVAAIVVAPPNVHGQRTGAPVS